MRIAKSSSFACACLLLCSCSFPHPLQDDVTGLQLSDIVRKITCEAREALDKQLAQRKLARERSTFKETKSNLNKLKNKVLKPREDEGEVLKREGKKLGFANEANNRELVALGAGHLRQSQLKRRPNSRKEKLGSLKSERVFCKISSCTLGRLEAIIEI